MASARAAAADHGAVGAPRAGLPEHDHPGCRVPREQPPGRTILLPPGVLPTRDPPFFVELLPKVRLLSVLVGGAGEADGAGDAGGSPRDAGLAAMVSDLSVSCQRRGRRDQRMGKYVVSVAGGARELVIRPSSAPRDGAEDDEPAEGDVESSSVAVVPLPVDVDPVSAVLSRLDEGVELKYRVTPASSTAGQEVPAVPLPAAALQGMCQMRCRGCGAPLLNFGTDEDTVERKGFKRVVDLPSRHWLELADCWVCHQEDYPQFRVGAIDARPGVALCSSTFVMVHGADVDRSALNAETWSDQQLESRPLLRCAGCHVRLGNSIETAGGDVALQFDKHRVLFEIRRGVKRERETVIPPPVSTFLVTDMLETARAHATYRFAVCPRGRQSSHPRLLVWLFSWDSQICANGWTSVRKLEKSSRESCKHFVSGYGKSVDVVKLLYMDCGDKVDEQSQRLLSSWLGTTRSSNQVEWLSYDNDECDEILAALRRSTLCLPLSRRAGIGGFTIGFLRR